MFKKNIMNTNTSLKRSKRECKYRSGVTNLNAGLWAVSCCSYCSLFASHVTHAPLFNQRPSSTSTFIMFPCHVLQQSAVTVGRLHFNDLSLTRFGTRSCGYSINYHTLFPGQAP